MSDSHRTPDWIDVREAMRRVTRALEPLSTEIVRLPDAVTRTLGEAIASPIDHPPWDNSAMDGFAARADDVRGANAGSPVRLNVIEDVPAGGFPTRTIERGQATRIMTGAPIPGGADSVIRVEHTRPAGHGAVLIVDDLDAGRNVRARAEDLRRGDVVLKPGRVLRAAEIGLLATVGAARVHVTCKPVVAILSTGDELADLDQYDEVLAGRKIANSNSYALAAAIQTTGAIPQVLGIARDDVQSLRDHLARARADLLVTTAGASVGDHDLVKDVLDSLGFDLGFWRVRMRPGSPFSFGWLRGESHRIPVFGLPGNPVSALVTFELFVRPAIRRLLGRSDLYAPTIPVRCAERIPSKAGLTHFQRARLRREADGSFTARLTGPQGSGLITSLAEADALLVVPEDRDGLDTGEAAWALRLDGVDAAQDVIGF